MLKVASVIPCLSIRGGGPSINLVESVPHLRSAGVDVTIFTTDMGAPVTARPWRASAADFPSGADECDVRVFRLESPRRFGYSPGLKRALRADLPAFDLARVHGLFLHPQYAMAAEAQRAAIPYLVSPHGALDPWVRRRGRLRKLITGIAWQDRMLREAAAIPGATGTPPRSRSGGATHPVMLEAIATAAPTAAACICGRNVAMSSFFGRLRFTSRVLRDERLHGCTS